MHSPDMLGAEALKEKFPSMGPIGAGAQAHNTAVLHHNCTLGAGVVVGARASLGSFVVIGKDSVVYENARIARAVTVRNQCSIGEEAILHTDCVLRDHVRVSRRVVVGARSVVRQGAHILERASLAPYAVIAEGSEIGAGRQGVTRSVHLAGFNEWGVTGYLCDDGLIINIGCANDYRGLPPDEMIERVVAKHGSGHSYVSMILLIEEWAENEVLRGWST